KIVNRGEAILQVVFVQHLLQSYGDRIQVPAREPAVSWKPLSQDEQILFLLSKQVIVRAEESSDVREPILLGRHRAPVREREHLLRNLSDRFFVVALFRKVDKARIFAQTKRVR